MKLSFALLALVAPLLSAATTVVARDTVDFNPVGVTIHPIGPHPQARSVPATNGERMRLGMPLKAPAHRRSTRTLAARHAQPSSAPGNGYSGRIKCTDKSGNFLGYVGKDVNQYGQWGLTNDASKAQPMSFTARDKNPFELVAAGGGPDPSIPLLGGVVGKNSPSKDLSTGSFSFAYISSTASTGLHSAAVIVTNLFNKVTGGDQPSQSGIWKFDAATLIISLQWINADGSAPETHCMWSPSNKAFAITGSPDQFKDHVASDAVEVVFKYEQA